MDFNSLIGTSAYVAKQLELKWFYHWEMITSQCDDGDDAPKGRLVRKRHHSMPFLHRNIIAHSNSWDGRRSPSRYSSAAGRRDEFDLHEFATSKLPAAAAARTKQRSTKRKIEAVEESSYYQAKGKKKKQQRKSDNNDNVVAMSHEKLNNQHKKFAPTFSNTTSLQLHLQNPIERKKIIDQVPKELHHDETYILERMKESWLRNNEKYNVKNDEISTNNGGDSIKQLSSNWESIILPPDVAFTSLKKVKANNGSKGSAGSNTQQPSEKLSPAYLHYIYMQPNNIPATIVEEINGRMCPFCNFDGGSNEGLISHCGIYHGTLLETNDNQMSMSVAKGRDGPFFEAALDEEKQLHIILRGGDPILPAQQAPAVDNFIFIQPRYVHNHKSNKQQFNVPYLQRLHRKTASLDVATRNRKLMALQANDAPATAISAYLPTDTVPLRQYYHASTNLPMTHSDWMKDSDEETDETWLHEMQSELLDEFEDVSPKEKQFMKLWNRYIKCNHVIADKDMPMKCHLFTLEYRKQLMDGGMRLNFLLHLFNLWDSGVISSARILSCMSLFDEAGNEDKKGKNGRRSSDLANSSECVMS